MFQGEQLTIFKLMDVVSCRNRHKLHPVVNTIDKFGDFLKSSVKVGELSLEFEVSG